MNAIPCRLCGYDAPGPECPHCAHRSTARSLEGERVGPTRAVLDGLRALPQGIAILIATRGVKRFLIPPVILTTIVFGVLFWWSMSLVDLLVEATQVEDVASLGLEEGWFKSAVVWLLEKGVATFVARLGGVLLWIVVSSVVALYTFSIVYEAVAGPFLDEIQGRIEGKWFGKNPRNAIQRPTDIPVKRCALLSTAAGIPAGGLLIAWWVLSGTPSWISLALAPLPFFVAAVHEREYGTWLSWVARVEGHTLWVSIKASIFVGILLVLCFPLKFIPLIGFPLFMAIAGFGTAITLLDIPFSRREWSLSTRLRFTLRNALPMTAFGVVASLLFLVPVIGPVVMVPSASIGGLWLVVRLDKNFLR
jgi:uncharacterized protein involved in cysteine biosynthesis